MDCFKKMYYSFYESVVIALNSFLGSPFNYFLTIEAIRSETILSEERFVLSEVLVPQMILASTISVSLLTPFIASICVKLLYG